MQKKWEMEKNLIEGYCHLHELNSLKTLYEDLGKEIHRLYKIDPITESGARKRMILPLVKEKREETRKKYESIYKNNVEIWLSNVFNSEYDMDKLTIFMTYYIRIENSNLQKTINDIYPPRIINGEKVLYDRASNLRDTLERRLRKEIEGR